MKRFFGIFLALIIIAGMFGFAGCDENVTVEPGPLGKYSPAVTVSYGKSISAVSSVLTAVDQTAEDNVWNSYIRSELGIKLKLTLGSSSDEDYYTKIISTIAAGNIPDFLEVGYFENGYINLKAMEKDDLLADIGSIVENYASEDLKSVVNSFDKVVYQPCTFDGKLMGFPQFYNVGGASPAFYWIRTDWLENLNLQMPTTFDELLAVAEAFTHQDPDQNNANDTYGFAADSAIFTSLTGIFNAHHSYPQTWTEDDDGNLVYGGILPETKEALKTLATLYANGCLKADFTALAAGTAATAQLNGGEAGIAVGVATSGLNYAQTIVRNNSAQLECIPFISADGDDVKTVSDIPAYTYYAVSAEAKYPEAMIKILNLFLEVGQGDRGDELVKTMIQDDAGNEIWKLSPISSMEYANSDDTAEKYDQLAELAESIKTRDSSNLKVSDQSVYNSIIDYLDKNVYRNWGWYALFKENGSLQKLVDARENDYFIYDKFNAAPTDSMNQYLDTLDVYQWTVFASIIVGEEPVDAFDTFVSEWLSQGGSDITEEVNAWYAQFKA